MYSKGLATDEVKANYYAYLPDSMPVVRDVSFTVNANELKRIPLWVGEDDGAVMFDFDDVSFHAATMQ